MIRLLSRWLIPDRDNVSSPAVRRGNAHARGLVAAEYVFIGIHYAYAAAKRLQLRFKRLPCRPVRRKREGHLLF